MSIEERCPRLFAEMSKSALWKSKKDWQVRDENKARRLLLVLLALSVFRMPPYPNLWKKKFLLKTGSLFCQIQISCKEILTEPRKKLADWRRAGALKTGETISFRRDSEIKMRSTVEFSLKKCKGFHLGKVIWDPQMGTRKLGKWKP